VQEPLASSSSLRDADLEAQGEAVIPEDALPNPLALLHGGGKGMEFMPL